MYKATVKFTVILPSGFKALATSLLSASSEINLNTQVDDFKKGYQVEDVEFF